MGKTVQIDDDVIQAAERLAAERSTTVDKVVSDLAREGLALASGLRLIEKGGFWVLPSRGRASGEAEHATEPVEYRNGFRLLPRTGGVVTPEMVEALLDEEP